MSVIPDFTTVELVNTFPALWDLSPEELLARATLAAFAGEVGLGIQLIDELIAASSGETKNRAQALRLRLSRDEIGSTELEAQRLGETVFLTAARAGAVVVLDKAEGTGFLRAAPRIGSTVPLHATAVGKQLA